MTDNSMGQGARFKVTVTGPGGCARVLDLPEGKEAVDFIMSLVPEFFNKRVDHNHPDYKAWKWSALSLACHQLVPFKRQNNLDHAWTAMGCMMYDKNFPVFYLSPDFFEVVNATALPDNIKPSELNMPFQAFALMLPRSKARALFGTDIPSIFVAKLTDGQVIYCQHQRRKITNELGKFLVLCNSYDTAQELPIHYGATCKPNDTILEAGQYEYTDALAGMLEYANINLTPEGERQLIIETQRFAVKLLCILNAAPELVEADTEPKRVKSKNGMVRYYKPNFIAPHYRMKTETTGTHASPRMHWRRGHARRQHYGKGMVQIRLIWIEPVLVNK